MYIISNLHSFNILIEIHTTHLELPCLGLGFEGCLSPVGSPCSLNFMGNNWCTASGFIAKLLIPLDEVDNADDMLPPPKA